MAGIQIDIRADFTKAKADFDALAQRLKQTGAAGLKFSNDMAVGANKAAAGLAKLPNASNQSTNALMNLSRVAQDAPYGFIGIANNINPLLESFQRLKATTGTTGGALKAMGASLMGPAGLGLAVGVVSSLMVVFGDRLFGAGKAAEKTKEKTDELKSSINGIFSSAAKEAAEVGSFITILKSETETRERKLATIKELQKIQPDVFNNLKLEGNAVIGLDNAYKEYLANLKNVIAAKIIQARVEQKIEELLKKQGVAATAEEKALAKLPDIVDSIRLKQVKNLSGADAAGLIQSITGRKDARNKEIKSLESDIENLFKELQNYTKNIKVNELKVKPDDVKIEMPPGKLWQFEMEVSEFNFAPKTLKVSKPVVITPVIDTKGLDKLVHSPALSKLKEITDDNSAKAWKELNEQWEYTANVLASSITPAFMEFIDAIGKGQNAFQAFGQMIKQVLTDVIKRLIETAIFASILSLVSGGNVKFGQAFTQLLGLGKRASGGPVSAGRPYIVGEVGRELFVPSTSGRIVPNNGLGSIIGGAMQLVNVTVNGRISGRDLVLVQARESRYQTNNV